jgi:citrate lyase subunit beta/citryl-CoA lyase/(S)-citramalyl-CoA lyase
VSSAIPRSILYTPALDAKRLEAARRHDADLYLIDFEDSVPAGRKQAARQFCREFLERGEGLGRTAVRINELRSIEYVYDLAALVESSHFPAFVFMTMVRSASEVEALRGALGSAGRAPEIYVTVETVEAVTALDEVASVSDGLILGSADLAAALGVEIRWGNMLYARQKMAYACARYQIACIDTGCFRLDDPEVLRDECARVKELGFHGKGTVHPAQLHEINRVFRPAPAEVASAQEVVNAATAHDDEISVLRGGMIGPPFVKKARKLLAMSEAWAQRFPPRG